VLAATGIGDGARPAVLIGKDTRVSGYMLESALEAGFAAAGIDTLLSGPLPTPGIAYLTRALRLAAGVVISASHNPFEDNGIKFFAGDGYKLPDSVETAIEAELDKPLGCVATANLGKAQRIDDAAGRYIEFCKSTFPARSDLRGLRMVVECAHGAAYYAAPHVFHELGADVVAISDAPDGFNINDACGATHPAALQQAVRHHGADIGIAIDGDGDRLIMADAEGRLYDGDMLLYVIAGYRQRCGRLAGGVAGTLMTNLGLEKALTALGIPFARANVGDRYVLELLRDRDWQLGGENSGHIVCLDQHTTGDAIVSALQVLAALLAEKTTLAEMTQPVTLYPQVLVNVRVAKGFDFRADAAIGKAVAAAEKEFDGHGRVLIRPSGTEPLLRVMVEGYPEDRIRQCAETIAEVARRAAAR
jgi:phosphoglucosamine mutase